MTAHSPNYDYVLETAKKIASTDQPRILDFGCGRGQTLLRGRELGMDVWGADSFNDRYANWKKQLDPSIADKVQKTANGGTGYPDHHFDVVISNMVFEHIKDLAPSFTEIYRVLKPGGAFLALFPTKDVWFEGHIGLYFPHWLPPRSRLQWRYLRAMRRMGLGYYQGKLSPEDWATKSQETLNEACVYHSWTDVKKRWIEAFGRPPLSYEADYMRFRIARHSKLGFINSLATRKVAAPFLRIICLVRAARVLVVYRQKS